MRWSDFHIPGPAYGVASYPKPASVLTALRGVLGDELENDIGVSIPGLGTFKTKTREERKVYSPHHESYMMIPPKRVVDFTPSSSLKDNLKFVETGDE